MLAVKAVASSCTHRLAVLVKFADARGKGCGIKLHTHKLALLVLFADARGQGCGIKQHKQDTSEKVCTLLQESCKRVTCIRVCQCSQSILTMLAIMLVNARTQVCQVCRHCQWGVGKFVDIANGGSGLC